MSDPIFPQEDSPSLIVQLRAIGTTYLLRFGLAVLVIWGGLSAFAVVRLVRERTQFFNFLIDSNQEQIASGQWRPFFEGLERDTGGSFREVEICWGADPAAKCGALKRHSLLLKPAQVPLMSGGQPLAWVRAQISLQPAAEFSLIILLAFAATGVLAGALMIRLKRDAELAGANLTRAVTAAAAQGGSAELSALPKELQPLARALTESLERLQALREREAVSRALWEIAAQVAHDVRSPLAALRHAVGAAPAADGEARAVIDGSLARIARIVDELLRKHRDPRSVQVPGARTVLEVWPLLHEAVVEKRVELADRPGVKLKLSPEAAPQRAAVEANADELRRLLSNLLNNAVEALPGKGTVELRLTAGDGRIHVAVADEGKGVPPEILAKLGRRGESHGKADGSGLGLYHARTSAEAWGGALRIDSEVGKGTTVTLSFPAAGTEPSDDGAILIDDDALARMTWTMAARRAGKRLRTYATVADFIKEADTFLRATPLYVDAELGDGKKGEEEALRLHGLGFTTIYLATGHSPEKFAGLAHLKGVIGKDPPWA